MSSSASTIMPILQYVPSAVNPRLLDPHYKLTHPEHEYGLNLTVPVQMATTMVNSPKQVEGTL
jgi:hypothetical protein